MSLAQPTLQEQVAVQMEQDLNDATELSGLLHTFVKHGNTRTLTRETFDNFLDEGHAHAYFEARGLSPATTGKFFHLLLDVHKTRVLSFKTFISACMRLDSAASTMDVHVLHLEMKAMHMTSCHFQKEIVTRVNALAVLAGVNKAGIESLEQCALLSPH